MPRKIRVEEDNTALGSEVYQSGVEVTVSDDEYLALVASGAIAKGWVSDQGDVLTEVESLVGTAPATLDTLGEIATSLLTKAASGLPSYSGTRTNPYDPRCNVYNLKPSNSRRLRASLSKAMGGQVAEWVVIGDSGPAGCTNGVTLTYERLNAWPIQMRDELARHGIAKGGTGLVRIRDNSATDARWGLTGAWNHSFLTSSYLAGAGDATFTSDLAGDRASVLYYDLGTGQGTFNISINGAGSGAGFLAVTQTNPTGWKVATLSPGALAVGATVKATRVSGTMMLGGAQVWSSTGGLVVHNIAQSGSSAGGTGNSSWSDTAGLGLVYTAPITNPTTGGATTPAVVFLSLGGNDLMAGRTAAQITSALTTIRNRYPNSDCVLIAPAPVNTTLVPAATWDAYITALYDLADTLDMPLVDFRARIGDYATFVANGLSNDGQGHLIGGAYAGLGRNLGLMLVA